MASCYYDWSQSPFGFWGDWNYFVRAYAKGAATSGHNRLSAFGVIGTKSKLRVQINGLSHNRLSAFGVIGTIARTGAIRLNIRGHNRLSAFGVIGTRFY